MIASAVSEIGSCVGGRNPPGASCKPVGSTMDRRLFHAYEYRLRSCPDRGAPRIEPAAALGAGVARSPERAELLQHFIEASCNFVVRDLAFHEIAEDDASAIRTM